MSAVRKGPRTWLSLWTVYLVWGSTYYAIAKVVETMPTLLSMGVRFLTATAILLLFIWLKQGIAQFKIPRSQYFTATFLGVGTLAVGIGSVAIAEKHIPTGVASLIIAALPLWIAFFRTLSREAIPIWSWAGTLVGFIGVVILLRPGGIEPISTATSNEVVFYMLLVMIGNFLWALFTFLSPRLPLPKNLLVFTAIQMLGAGVALVIIGLIQGEKFGDFATSSNLSWFWFWYLVTVGSIIAYTAYLWLVVNAPVSLTATYAYVNPVIAVLLGVLFLNEVITLSYAIGGAVIILGVLVVVTSESRRREALT